jgi:hypothetical protein
MRASLDTGLAFVFSAVTPAFQGASLAGAADGPRPLRSWASRTPEGG